jgi:hypothetical protein
MVLPSKNVLSVFIVVAALVAAIIITFGRDKADGVINYANNLVAGEKISVPENPDWQSELGKISSGATTPGINSASSSEEMLTDTVSRTLISNYLVLKQNSSLNQTSAQELIDRTLQYVEETGTQVSKITEANLNIVADNGRISVAQYGDNLGYAFKNNRPTEMNNELEIIAKVMESKDPSKLEQLEEIIAIYEKISLGLIRMPVPKTFIKVHLDITNGIMGMISSLKGIPKIYNDPMSILVVMKTYQENATMFFEAVQATTSFIIKNNIVYKQGSGGHYLMYGI